MTSEMYLQHTRLHLSSGGLVTMITNFRDSSYDMFVTNHRDSSYDIYVTNTQDHD